MLETIKQRPTRREVLPYNGIRANTQPLCPEFWIRARQPGSGGKATVDPATGRALSSATSDLAAAKEASRETPSHLPLGKVRPGSRLLETERKLLTHAIRMSAYNAESALARLLRPHYARGDDEARALLREAFTLSGDLQI